MSIFIHATAEVSDKAKIGKNTKIWNGVQIREKSCIGSDCIISKNVYIDAEVVIGDRVKIQNNVNVYHGVTIEDDVFLGPSMTFTNDLYPRAFNENWEVVDTLVEKGASLGANVTVVCGVTVGRYSMTGSGSVITKDILDYALMVGNPAKRIGWVCQCGNKLETEGKCCKCGKQYEISSDKGRCVLVK